MLLAENSIATGTNVSNVFEFRSGIGPGQTFVADFMLFNLTGLAAVRAIHIATIMVIAITYVLA